MFLHRLRVEHHGGPEPMVMMMKMLRMIIMMMNKWRQWALIIWHAVNFPVTGTSSVYNWVQSMCHPLRIYIYLVRLFKCFVVYFCIFCLSINRYYWTWRCNSFVKFWFYMNIMVNQPICTNAFTMFHLVYLCVVVLIYSRRWLRKST